VLLDWISFIEPYAPANITPWNPHTGLSFVLVLLFGRRMIPLLFIGPLLADIVLNLSPVPWVVELSFVVLIGGGYSAALLFLSRPSMRFDPALLSMRDLVLLMLVAAASAAFVASSYVAVATFAGMLPIKDFAAATLRYWVGDMIGNMVVTPFAMIALTRDHVLRMSLETLLQFAAIIGALALVLYAEEQRFQLFYFLFLPIVWMAVRAGLEGVSAGIVITQVGLIVGVMVFPAGGHNVTGLQILMLVLSATGLVAGELVTERRRTDSRLRLHQESLSRVTRLGSMGELD
jgi:two-component system sensor kinase FixL